MQSGQPDSSSLDEHRVYSAIEQHIGPRSFQVTLAHGAHSAIVEFQPSISILGVGCVVTAAESTVMIAYCIKLIFWFRASVLGFEGNLTVFSLLLE